MSLTLRATCRLATTGLVMVLAVGAGTACLVRVAADGGPLPLDSARAVAIAQRNLCGQPSSVKDTTCLVRGYQRRGSDFVVLLDRRPPAGNDRVAVRLSGNGMRVDVTPIVSKAASPND